jgi:anti-anti-sigma regulatory factor
MGRAPVAGRTVLARTKRWKEVMLNVTVAKLGEVTVVGCEGTIVQRESAYKLREAVTSQTDARIVVLELSEVRAIGGGGLGMLVSLQRWAREHNIRFLLFHPSKSVQSKLKRARSIAEFYISSSEEMRALLAYANSRYAQAA